MPPAPDTRLIGRDRELALLGERFESGARLVTLLGPGGVGKTRLAFAFLSQRPEGAWSCDLSSARTKADVIRLVAQALEVSSSSSSSSPTDPDSLDAALDAALLDRPVRLLLLDDCERAVEAVAACVTRWLGVAPGLQVLCTSRIALRITEEWRLPLDGLSPEDALALYRVRALQGGVNLGDDALPVLRQLVERLDLLPLAIELAAARAPVLPPARLIEALDRRFELLQHPDTSGPADVSASARHRSLEATLESSWELLSREEQQALGALSCFEAPFDVADAEAVIGSAAVALLERLQARSFVAPAGEGGRLRLLETVRAFVASRMGNAERLAAEVRHAEHVARQGMACREAQQGPDPAKANTLLRRLAPELLSAFHRTSPRTDSEQRSLTVRLALALDALLVMQGPAELHAEVLDTALAHAQAGSPALHSDVLVARGRSRALRGFNEDALVDADRALAIAPDDRARSLAEIARSFALRQLGRFDEAIAAALRALELAGEDPVRGMHQGHLGAALYLAGRLDEAAEAYTRAVALQHQAGMRRLEALTTGNLGLLRAEQGRIAEAERLLRAGMEAMDAIGDRMISSRFRWHLARHLDPVHRAEHVRALLDEADAAARALGDRELRTLVLITRARLEPDLAERHLDEAERLAVPFGERLLSRVSAARAGGEAVLTVSHDGAAFSFAPSAHAREPTSLHRRPTLRRILLRLVEEREGSPGSALDVYALLEAGWPRAAVHPESGSQRVWTAIRTLRRMGLEDVLLSRDGGYLLDPAVPLRRPR